MVRLVGGMVCSQAGRPAEAAPLFARAIAIHQAACGSNTRQLATQLNNLAKSLRHQAKPLTLKTPKPKPKPKPTLQTRT